MVPDQPSAGEELVRALVGFPKYIAQWTIGLIVAILTDLHITTLALTGATVGLAFASVLVGLAAFFVAYSASRVIGNVANAIGIGLGNINRLADATYQGLTAPPLQGIEPSPDDKE